MGGMEFAGESEAMKRGAKEWAKGIGRGRGTEKRMISSWSRYERKGKAIRRGES